MMNLRQRIFYGFIQIVIDTAVLVCCCAAAYILRFRINLLDFAEAIDEININFIIYIMIFIGVTIALLVILGMYDLRKSFKGPAYLIKIIISVAAGAAILMILGWGFGLFRFSRLWLLMLILVSLVLMIAARIAAGTIVKKIYSGKKDFQRDLFIVGFKENIRAIKGFQRSRKKIIYGFLLVINDIIFLAIAFYFSFYLRFNTGAMAEANPVYQIETDYVFYSIIFIISALIIFFLYRLYNWDHIYRGSGYYSRIIKGSAINIVVIILAGYLFQLFTFSRKWILLLFILSIALILLSRLVIESLSIRIMRKIKATSRTIVIGLGENAKRIEDSFKKYSLEGDKILGFVDDRHRIEKDKEYFNDFNILGYIDNIEEVIENHKIQRIIISSPEYKYYELLDILEKLKSFDVSVLVFPGFFEFSIRRMNMREIAGIPLMQVSNVGFSGINLFLKNILDYSLGSIAFLFFIPIYLAVGFAIKIDSRGPVFYKQKRYTKDCKVFYMYKFRSMYVDAESRLAELQKYNEADGPMFKMKNDPRITRVGKFIRKFSIDELPQIINVLRGEMSLVGPRPPLPVEVEQYDEWEMKRMNVKQGITGLWQISGRSELSFEEMARLDLYYIQNWSIEMDIKILLKTAPAALFGKGAY